MERLQTLTILNALANGIHPGTGEQFPPDSPYQHPDTVRALFTAVRMLESRSSEPSAAPRTRAADATTQIGMRWTPEEEQRLVAAFDAGKGVRELAAAHGRSTAAIEARLLKLGKIDASALTTPLRYGGSAGPAGGRPQG